MDSKRFKRVKELFQAALQLDPSQRAAYLDGACRDDAGLRNEVERLLESDSDASFLETPATTGLPPGWSEAKLEGARIGRYHLVRLISSGGMGTVYEGIQEQPERTVAVKVMKQGMASKSALRRFEYEAEILAHLRHASIAQVIEAGTHDGLPYFVMEYIPGARSLTEYVEAKGLSSRQRLALFLEVCEAVHYGHQRGVIHRDLKPSNLLVDEQGKVKVIDFGVARATDSDVALTTMQTEVGQLIGTLQYMSPEQCAADPHDLDMRSDVYALGVVLYEMLCGALPYDVRQTPVYEGARLIREAPPKRPSTVNRILRGDVETILLKALEKERRQRYQTVTELAADIRRYLNGEVIHARPVGPATRFVKRVKRNPLLSAAMGGVLVCIVGFGLYVVLYSYPRIQEEKAKLEAELGNTRQINAFLEEMLSWADPFKTGREITVPELLDRAADRIDEAFPDKPEIEASLRKTLGTTYFSNARYEAADRQFTKSLDLCTNLFGDEHLATVSSKNDLASVYAKQDRFEEAEALYLDALDGYRRLLGEDHLTTLLCLTNLGELYTGLGRYAEAETLLLQVLEKEGFLPEEQRSDLIITRDKLAALYTKLDRREEAVALFLEVLEAQRITLGEDHPTTLSTKNSLANMYFYQGRYDEAESIYLETLEGKRRTLGEDHPQTLTLRNNLAQAYHAQARYQEAEALLRETVDRYCRVLGEDHSKTLNCMNNLADLYNEMARYDESAALLKVLLEARRRKFGVEHQDTLSTLMDIAKLRSLQGRYDEAERLFREVMEKRSRVLGEEHIQTINAKSCVASALLNQGRYEEAEPLCKSVFENRQRELGMDHRITLNAMHQLAILYFKMNRLKDAEKVLLEVLEHQRDILGDDHPDTLDSLNCLTAIYYNRRDYTKAEPLVKEILETRRRILGGDHPDVITSIHNLGSLYYGQGRYEEAESLLREALDRCRQVHGEDHSSTLNTLMVLADFLENTDRLAEAEPMARELLERTPEDSRFHGERKQRYERVKRKLDGME